MAKMPSWLDTSRFTDRKYFFRVQKIGWRLIGFWPGSDNISTLQILIAILNSLEVLIYAVFQLTFCYANRANLVVILDAMTPCATQITSAVKILIIVSRRKDIKVVLDHLKRSFYDGNWIIKMFELGLSIRNSFQLERSREYDKIHGEISRYSFVFAAVLLFFTNMTHLFFWSLPAVRNLYNMAFGPERSYHLPFKAM